MSWAKVVIIHYAGGLFSSLEYITRVIEDIVVWMIEWIGSSRGFKWGVIAPCRIVEFLYLKENDAAFKELACPGYWFPIPLTHQWVKAKHLYAPFTGMTYSAFLILPITLMWRRLIYFISRQIIRRSRVNLKRARRKICLCQWGQKLGPICFSRA